MPRLWLDTVLNQDVANAGALVQSLMVNFTARETRISQMTLLRTIIGLDLAYTVHDAGEGSQIVSLGIGVASQEAFAAGIVADPNDGDDFPTRGWIWRASYRVFGFAADQPAVFTRRIDLDMRSMRKLENGECYMNVMNTAAEGVSSTVKVSGLIRQLYMVS